MAVISPTQMVGDARSIDANSTANKSAVATNLSTREAPTTTTVSPTQEQITHTVQKGDTLWGVSEQYLGTGTRWGEIQGYTGDPRKMPVGTVLTIGGQQAQDTQWTQQTQQVPQQPTGQSTGQQTQPIQDTRTAPQTQFNNLEELNQAITTGQVNPADNIPMIKETYHKEADTLNKNYNIIKDTIDNIAKSKEASSKDNVRMLTDAYNQYQQYTEKALASYEKNQKMLLGNIDDRGDFLIKEQGVGRDIMRRDLDVAYQQEQYDYERAIADQKEAVAAKRARDEAFQGVKQSFGSAQLENMDYAEMQGRRILEGLTNSKAMSSQNYANKQRELEQRYLLNIERIALDTRDAKTEIITSIDEKKNAIMRDGALTGIQKAEKINKLNQDYQDELQALQMATAENMVKLNTNLMKNQIDQQGAVIAEQQRVAENEIKLMEENRKQLDSDRKFGLDVAEFERKSLADDRKFQLDVAQFDFDKEKFYTQEQRIREVEGAKIANSQRLASMKTATNNSDVNAITADIVSKTGMASKDASQALVDFRAIAGNETDPQKILQLVENSRITDGRKGNVEVLMKGYLELDARTKTQTKDDQAQAAKDFYRGYGGVNAYTRDLDTLKNLEEEGMLEEASTLKNQIIFKTFNGLAKVDDRDLPYMKDNIVDDIGINIDSRESERDFESSQSFTGPAQNWTNAKAKTPRDENRNIFNYMDPNRNRVI